VEKFTPGGVHIFLNTFFAILHTLFVLKSVIAYTNIFQQNLLSSYGYEKFEYHQKFWLPLSSRANQLPGITQNTDKCSREKL